MAVGWGKVNNWAAEVEEEEAQNGGTLPVEDFPSLSAAKVQAPKPKKKPTKMGLADFMATSNRSTFGSVTDKEILTVLPTGSRGKTDQPATGGLGGGFREYGRDREFGDREERRPRQEDMGPSRADEADDWSKDRKFVAGSGGGSSFGSGYESRGFGGGSGGGGFSGAGRGDRGEPRDAGAASRADDSDAWGRDKTYQPSSRGFADRGDKGYGDRDGGFGDRDRGFGGRSRGGFGDRGGDRDRSYGGDRPEVDSDWGRGRPAGNGFGFDSSNRDREKGYNFNDGPSKGDAVDRWTRTRDDSTNDTEERRTERPRLNLKPRTVPVAENGSTADPAAGAAADAAAAAPDPAPAPAPSPAPAPRKSNPFGNARPREEVLKEKGVDYKKQELKLEHDSSLRPDTEEEEKLKADIELLRTKLEALSANDSTDPEELQDLKNDIETRETHLLNLAADLDRLVKYPTKEAQREGNDRGRSRDNQGRERREEEQRGYSSRSRDRFDQSRERQSRERPGW